MEVYMHRLHPFVYFILCLISQRTWGISIAKVKGTGIWQVPPEGALLSPWSGRQGPHWERSRVVSKWLEETGKGLEWWGRDWESGCRPLDGAEGPDLAQLQAAQLWNLLQQLGVEKPVPLSCSGFRQISLPLWSEVSSMANGQKKLKAGGLLWGLNKTRGIMPLAQCLAHRSGSIDAHSLPHPSSPLSRTELHDLDGRMWVFYCGCC